LRVTPVSVVEKKDMGDLDLCQLVECAHFFLLT